jgi:hypothetical protein
MTAAAVDTYNPPFQLMTNTTPEVAGCVMCSALFTTPAPLEVVDAAGAPVCMDCAEVFAPHLARKARDDQ